jgi:seryl-tRNA synthetase
MHDIKTIRENGQAFDAAMQLRGMEPQAARLLELDETRRTQLTHLQKLQAERNELAKKIGMAKKAGENADALMEQSRQINEALAATERLLEGEDALHTALASLPNLLEADVPEGADESGNSVLRHVGAKPHFAFPVQDHIALGEGLGMMDFESAAKLSGSRFVVLKNQLAKLERALAQFMLDEHGKRGYTEIVPPLLVRDNAVFGTGQLPKFSEDLFRTENGYWLIPTAEVPLANLVADSILSLKELPLRYTAYTPCFRSEAGAAGKDTRGMIRQHQFSKVELVSVTAPEDSRAEHERMLEAAENILQKLGLHYRVVLLCSGDTGFCSQKTCDIEVWLPGQDTYREISSCSNCGAFQARRMKARFRREGANNTEFVHTLNGSGLAIGRTMIAVLENYQQADGSVLVPEALRPYMGTERISGG